MEVENAFTNESENAEAVPPAPGDFQWLRWKVGAQALHPRPRPAASIIFPRPENWYPLAARASDARLRLSWPASDGEIYRYFWYIYHFLIRLGVVWYAAKVVWYFSTF